MAADPRRASPDMKHYYSKRAAEYEQIYRKPERQHELDWLRRRIPELLKGRTVLEVACGTGYWTQFIARTARKVHACDINESVLRHSSATRTFTRSSRAKFLAFRPAR